MPYFVVPDANAADDLTGARLYPNAAPGDTLGGLMNGTAYRVYSVLQGPTVTPEGAAAPIPAQHLWIGAVDATSALITVTAAGATDLTLSAEPVGGGTIRTATASFDPTYGFARVEVTGLEPDTEYQIVPVINGTRDTSKAGSFKTRPTTRKAFTFGFASCGHINHNSSIIFNTIRSMIGNAPFDWSGDRWYADVTENNLGLFHAREKTAMSVARNADFHRLGPVLFRWDDHDYAGNDSKKASPAGPAAREWYRSYVPMRPADPDPVGAVHSEVVLAPGFHLLGLDARSQREGTNFLGNVQEAWLISRLQAIGEDPLAVVGINAMVPFISLSGTDNWNGATAQRKRIRDAVNTYMPGRVFMMAGDAHMLAFDDGTNNDGIPLYQSAPLGTSNSVKGGPYSGGTVTVTQNQFSTIDATPTADGWTITYKGFSVDTGGVATQRLIHTAQLRMPTPNPDVAPTISADPVLHGTGIVGTTLTVSTAPVSGKPIPTESVTMLRDGTPSLETFPYTILTSDEEVSFAAVHRAENSLGTVERVSNEVTAVLPAGNLPTILQYAAGHATESAGAGKLTKVTLNTPATPGSLLLLFVMHDKQSSTFEGVSGLTLHKSHTTSNGVGGAVYSKIAQGGETSLSVGITYTGSSTRYVELLLLETNASVVEAVELGTDYAGVTSKGSSATIAASADTLAITTWHNDSATNLNDATSAVFNAGWDDLTGQGIGTKYPVKSFNSNSPGWAAATRPVSVTGALTADFNYIGSVADENMTMLVTLKKGA